MLSNAYDIALYMLKVYETEIFSSPKETLKALENALKANTNFLK